MMSQKFHKDSFRVPVRLLWLLLAFHFGSVLTTTVLLQAVSLRHVASVRWQIGQAEAVHHCSV